MVFGGARIDFKNRLMGAQNFTFKDLLYDGTSKFRGSKCLAFYTANVINGR